MKVYYVAHCRFPSERAHAIQIAKMTEAMWLRGTDVELIVPRRRNDITQSPREFYGLKTDIPVHYLPVLDLYGWRRGGYITAGCTFIASYLFFLLWKKLRRERFSLYTIDMDHFSFIGVSFVGVPFIMEIHGAKKYRTLLNWMFTRAQAILTINQFNKQSLVRNYRLPRDKIIVFPNGIDIDLFSRPVERSLWRERWRISPNTPLVVYVGRCYDWKGVGIFIEAFQRLPEATFAFVGCRREEFEKVTGEKCDYQNVLFFGERPYGEMPDWMKSADILVVLGTRKNDYSYAQTSPMKLFEYMATGVPILAADTPAIRDAVSEKEVVFYEPDNVTSFAESIQTILRDQPRAAQVAARAQQAVRALSWENRAEAILGKF